MQSGSSSNPISSRFRIPFRDVDMHGHVHNGAYLSYIETAINDFLRHSGLEGHFVPGAEGRSYHVKKTELTYESPLGFDEAVVARVRVGRIGNSSLTFEGSIERESDNAVSVLGTVVWVCVDTKTRTATSIPSGTRQAISAALNMSS
ncbi:MULTISPECIES: acyl-CoA thioesterase [unclassified Bradyrhizobium]|uniref:acyl-CoA thioesterase n=1 Tax=unclassified Bradyrhizobium TaxID=2631580 RepID=UPI0023052568|nr:MULTISPECIES: thioesterase family protein [unclassified Bradyrhizobium]MDA9412890.1 hypothetical protein [Bradyrhizobium sp. CCBAU 45384]MDA9438420.1 hypothetical protein [Bradyrhizobium sp. CCBAU 51745]